MFSDKPKYKKIIKAVLKNDKSNKNNTGLYEFYKGEESVRYFVIEPNIDGYMLYHAFLNKFNQKDKEIEIDLDSFTSIVKEEKYLERLLMSLVSSLVYCSSIPYSEKTSKQNTLRFNISGKSVSQNKSKLQEYLIVAESQTFTRRLQDMPSSLITPAGFVKEVKNHFKGLEKSGVKISVLEKKDLIAKKMGSILCVGQGATIPENTQRILIIEYIGNPKNKQKYAYVGKGVCFDTGGYNIKTAGHMRWMKYDMSGSAIVSGAVYALAKNKIKTNVVAVCPLVINLVSETAVKPDDIITSYSGKTIEIDNTDAEGRLILADAITYAAKDLKADKIFEVSTLTGAMVYSLGETYTGTWATDETIWNEALTGAKQAGEQVWRLPFHKEFIAMLKSNFADLSNSCNGPAAGSSRAACFLKEFTLDKPFVHFDVAATADKGNTGTGVILRTLYNIAKYKN